MRGKILDVYPKGISTVYKYLCLDEGDDLFSFPVEHRYHFEIIEGVGNPIGREIEYDNDVDPPYLMFLD
jgi:hypothetical protein